MVAGDFESYTQAQRENDTTIRKRNLEGGMTEEAGKTGRTKAAKPADDAAGIAAVPGQPGPDAVARKPAKPKDKDFRIFNEEVAAIVAGVHANPFAVLGVHEFGKEFVTRAFVPGAETLVAFTLGGEEIGAVPRRDNAGFFEGVVPVRSRQPLRYHARNAIGEWDVVDPYSFGPVLGPLDDYYLREGSHLRLFDKMGAHPIHHEGIDGFHFAVWAPNAARDRAKPGRGGVEAWVVQGNGAWS
eukprot:gene55515-76067_t